MISFSEDNDTCHVSDNQSIPLEFKNVVDEVKGLSNIKNGEISVAAGIIISLVRICMFFANFFYRKCTFSIVYLLFLLT